MSAGRGLSPTSLGTALAVMKQPDKARPDLRLGGLSVSRRHGSEIWSHPGGTGGYASVVAFDPLGARAVVLLANGLRTSPIDLARALELDPKRHRRCREAPPGAGEINRASCNGARARLICG